MPDAQPSMGVGVETLQLTGPQEAAVARLAYAAEQPGSIAVLCGPAGVGKTTVLRHLAATAAPGGPTVRLAGLEDLANAVAEVADPDASRTAAATAEMLLIDDADRHTAADLAGLVERWRRRRPRGVLVLAGGGRLLTLVSADPRLEHPTRLRATIPVFTLAESCRQLAARVPALAAGPDGEAVMRTIHEIAAGSPAISARLADMAAMLLATDPGRGLSPDAIELLHRRLSLRAA